MSKYPIQFREPPFSEDRDKVENIRDEKIAPESQRAVQEITILLFPGKGRLVR